MAVLPCCCAEIRALRVQPALVAALKQAETCLGARPTVHQQGIP